jgi:hypothetical protein
MDGANNGGREMKNVSAIEILRDSSWMAEQEVMEINGLYMDAVAYNSPQASELWKLLDLAEVKLEKTRSAYLSAVNLSSV